MGVTRNQACPCGSGRKFKRCCGREPQAARATGSERGAQALAAAQSNLGVALSAENRWDEALQSHDRAVQLARGTPLADLIAANRLGCIKEYQAYLFGMYRGITDDPSAVLGAHRRLGEQVEAAAASARPVHANSRDPDRRLRIGYVSPDFRTHSVAYFIEPVIATHDRRAVEVFCYYTCPLADAVTERFSTLADHWRPCAEVSASSLAEQVRADGIDILIDLAGHTVGNRWLTFALKPAPVQIAYLGYPATTGLGAVDYRLTDVVADPPGLADAGFVEAPLRIAGGAMLVYRPAFGPGSLLGEEAPPVRPTPALGNGHVTFGSCNDAAKLNDAVFACWARLLAEVPASRLLLKSRDLSESSSGVVALRRTLEARGIDRARLVIRGRDEDRRCHFERYGEIDVALDPFPYNGVTTSFEALFMGVPVVTLAGGWPSARMGATIATHLAHPEWIATSTGEYIAIATALAADPQALDRLRRSLRDELLASPLTDAAGFVTRLESTYRAAWRAWCASARAL
jgi:predicted O-linked N-acetylglucosamine transferase (SPINDLY family)